MERNYVYRNFTKELLDQAYDNTRAVENSRELLENFSTKSAEISMEYPNGLNIRYGRHPRECLDYFSGFDVANIGYPLAPDVNMREIVRSIRSALGYLRIHSGDLGFDNSHVYVSGWSAGAHLAVSVLDEVGVCGALAISGIYDLKPISQCFLNDKLQLTENEILLYSPLRRSFVKKPIAVVVGADELPELRRQSAEFAMHRTEEDIPGSFNLLTNHNHFTILGELENPEGSLTQLLVQLIKY